MTLASPIAIALQNLWLNWVYWVAFVVVTFITGAWIGVLIAFILASAVSFAFRRFVNKTSAIESCQATTRPLLHTISCLAC